METSSSTERILRLSTLRALMFTAKGLRPFPIEYFAPGELAKARVLLASP